MTARGIAGFLRSPPALSAEVERYELGPRGDAQLREALRRWPAAAGATVTGVAGTRKLGLVHDLGATDVIDYTREDFADGWRTFDVILDTGGATPIERLRRALTRSGTLVIIGGGNGASWSPGMSRQPHATLLNPFVSQRLTMIMNGEDHSGLERLAALAEDGTVASFVDRPFALRNAAGAVGHFEAGRAMGKVVITV